MRIKVIFTAEVDDEAVFLPSDSEHLKEIEEYLRDLLWGVPDLEIKTMVVRDVE